MPLRGCFLADKEPAPVAEDQNDKWYLCPDTEMKFLLWSDRDGRLVVKYDGEPVEIFELTAGEKVIYDELGILLSDILAPSSKSIRLGFEFRPYGPKGLAEFCQLTLVKAPDDHKPDLLDELCHVAEFEGKTPAVRSLVTYIGTFMRKGLNIRAARLLGQGMFGESLRRHQALTESRVGLPIRHSRNDLTM